MSSPSILNPESSILFVTGRLAEASLREVVSGLSNKIGFHFEIAVPGIQVAALLHAKLLLKRLDVPPHVERVILPGWCQGDLRLLEDRFQKSFERGPKDLIDLPEHFGIGKRSEVTLDRYSIEIIGEINHATRMPLDAVIAEAESMAADGANVIDIGCIPGETCSHVGDIVTALRDEGLRVSIDSFDRTEVEQAVTAGAELILSCNHSNIDWVSKLETEVVVIPDSPDDTESLDHLIERLTREAARFRIDPIIEPIGIGFTQSLRRYMDIRKRYPDIPMMMGVGNITELTEVDSAGVNLVLAAVCEELRVQSVLTTQVINWCRTAVAEFDASRRLVHHALTNRVIPKHLDSSLVMLRDVRLKLQSPESLQSLAEKLTDANFRIFAEQDGLHLMNSHGHWHGNNPFEIFKAALKHQDNTVDAGHAFYLGYEMALAELARHLGKQYRQDEQMTWGLLGQLTASSATHHHHNDKDE